MKAAKFSRWVIVLDYNADPEVDSDLVRRSLEDELRGFRGGAVVFGEKLILDHAGDALSMRMRFSDNIVSISKFDPKKVLVMA
jgi:hypothetical protein